MDELQAKLTRSAELAAASDFKDAYLGYLEVLEAAAIELRKIKFIRNVAIAHKSTVSLISIARSSMASAQDILARHNADIATISEPQPASPNNRKTSLSRHTERLNSGEARSVTMLTEQLQAAAAAARASTTPTPLHSPSSSSTAGHGSKDDPCTPHPRPTSSSSTGTTTPVTHSPLLRAASSNSITPPKPTRRPPPSPKSESPVLLSLPEMDTIAEEQLQPVRTSIEIDMILLQHPESPSPLTEEPQNIDVEATPLVGSVHLSRNLSETRISEEHSLDEDDSDEDEDDQDLAPVEESPHQLHRKTSSPSIPIVTTRRRSGSSASEPASHSPTNAASSCPSPQASRSFSQTRYLLLRQSSAGAMISIIPEGCVDPTSLVEAERINGDDEDQLDLKTYGPSDHLPLIPISPLRTSHRTLLEKEKSWSSMLVDAKHKLQARLGQIHAQQDTHINEEQRLDDDAETQELQDDLRKYTLQIGNVMATITKVRDLLYRSASITSILEFPPYLVAYQLTLVESAIFLEIPPAALLTHSPKSPHARITASTDFFNYLTRMIEHSILFPPEASGRAQSMNHWIKVAVKLHELMNFQTLKAVLSALGTPPIKRLKRTWSFLPRKSANKLDMLSELMSESRNYGKYREMMNSLWAGAVLSSPEATSPILPDSSSAISGSRFDILASWSSPDIKSKEPIRMPMVPFLGTFIMDMTYLLAAVKNSSQNGSAPSVSQVSATSSLRDRTLSVNTTFRPEDDLRVQDLLLTLTAYQTIPRYSPQPPRSFIKASIKSQNHFRAPSLSSALQMTTKYRTATVDRDRSLSSFEDDEDELFGGIPGSGGIRSSQQLILHYLLTRTWVPERMVDELSMIREPPKNNNGNNSKASNLSSGSMSSWSSISATNSGYSQTSSLVGVDSRTSLSNDGSRSTSMDEE
ncbi:RasGEF [Mortierella alpina]|nr:RasGEF [Mortierella alpina]